MLPPIPCSSGFEILWLPFRRTGTLGQTFPRRGLKPFHSRKVVTCQNSSCHRWSQVLSSFQSPREGSCHGGVSLTDHGETVGPTGPVRDSLVRLALRSPSPPIASGKELMSFTVLSTSKSNFRILLKHSHNPAL